MGGIGSGRRYKTNNIKPLLEDQISINIHDFNKEGLLVPGNSFTNFHIRCAAHIPDIQVKVEENSLLLKYWYNHYPYEQQIQIKNMPAHYGGSRPYFTCPDCGERRVSLYMSSSTGQFSCRACHKFGYKSQRMTPHLRHAYMAGKYKDKLGQSSYPYSKPFRMWSTTFFQLQDKACEHEKKSCDLFLAYVNNFLAKYGSVVDKDNGLWWLLRY